MTPFLARFRGGATPADFSERLLTVNKLAAVGLLAADRDFSSQFRQPETLPLLPFLEKPQPFPHDFALRLVQPALKLFGDKLVETPELSPV